MKWRMKVGIEWKPSMAGRPNIGGRLATFSLLSPPLSPSLAQPPHLWDRMVGLWPYGLRDGNGSGSGRVEQLPARQQRGCG
jgi:hypothetical protein